MNNKSLHATWLFVCLSVVAVLARPQTDKTETPVQQSVCHRCATQKIVDNWDKLFFAQDHLKARMTAANDDCQSDDYYDEASLPCAGTCFTMHVSYASAAVKNAWFGTMRGCFPEIFPANYRLSEPSIAMKPYERWCEWVDHFNPTPFRFQGRNIELKFTKDICFCSGDGCNGARWPRLNMPLPAAAPVTSSALNTSRPVSAASSLRPPTTSLPWGALVGAVMLWVLVL